MPSFTIRNMHPEPPLRFADSPALISLALVVADQLTKYLVEGLPHPLTIGVISVGKVVNPLGVFGVNISNTWLVIIGLIICAALAVLLISVAKRPPTRLGLWLLLGGAVSNVLDRYLHGGVTDIVAIGSASRFNLADVMIILGALALLRSTWWQPKP